MYEWLIKDVKKIKDVQKTLYKILGRTDVASHQLETVVTEIERNLNNRPLTCNVESDDRNSQAFTPNVVVCGETEYPDNRRYRYRSR